MVSALRNELHTWNSYEVYGSSPDIMKLVSGGGSAFSCGDKVGLGLYCPPGWNILVAGGS